MNIQRIKAIVTKEWKGIIRQPAILFLIILFPMVMTFTYGIAFGGMSTGTDDITYSIGVVSLNTTESIWTENFIDNLTANEVFNIGFYDDNESAQVQLSQGALSAVIIIPKDFSDSIESLWNDIYADGEANDTASWTNVTLSIYLDEGSIFAQMVIIPLVQQTLIETIYGQTNSIELPVEINDGSIESEDKSQFDFMMPGLYAFAIMFLTMTIAQSIVEEREKGILTRMNTTPTSSTEFISSHTTANVVVAAVQVIIVHLVATVMGFNPNVGLDGLAIGFLISIIYSVSVVGFGLITVSMSKSSGAATGLSFLFIIPQLMLGGFIPNIPEVVGRLMPNYYVTDALTSLFLRGASVNSPTILYDLLMVSIYSIVVFVISIIIYQKFGKKQ